MHLMGPISEAMVFAACHFLLHAILEEQWTESLLCPGADGAPGRRRGLDHENAQWRPCNRATYPRCTHD